MIRLCPPAGGFTSFIRGDLANLRCSDFMVRLRQLTDTLGYKDLVFRKVIVRNKSVSRKHETG